MFRSFVGLRAGLLVLLGGLSWAAAAQTIQADPGGESCALTPKCEKFAYQFVAGPGQTFLRWQVRGDLKLLTPDTDNPATICSEGYGKGRITAHYYTLRKDKNPACREMCPDTVYHVLNYDVFKQFAAPDPVRGAACARPGQDVTYSVPPILTDWPHRAAGIGTDSYFWSGFPAGTVLHFSGDSSSVTATLPATLASGFVVQVQVGRCNAKAFAQLAVTLGQNLLTAVTLTACQTGTFLPYATLEIATISGTTYAVSLPVGWHFAQASTGTLIGNGTTQGVHFTLDSAAGNILITATGGCDGPQMTGLSFTQ